MLDRTAVRLGRTPVVLVAHGSRDPRAALATEALAEAVRSVSAGTPVWSSYLDHAGPRPGDVLHALEEAGHDRATMVPLLLTAAYHRRVDIPDVVAAARAAGLRIPVRLAEVLGPDGGPVDELLIMALTRRLMEAGVEPGAVDGLVLAAAGTRDARARGAVDQVASALGAAWGVSCVSAYASAASPTPAEAVRHLRSAGAPRVAMAGYFLAPGRLYGVAADSARAGGAVAVSAPLEAADEVAHLVLTRATAPPPSSSI
ncbi:sirohydrochlorin chelatase [Plantactinospora sp. GCM10030261]|uniref:sirohydrochlorin chelatase n=1 Tax=Plantactinospora sp. GCM10030261 TaxID=3273420 RepID=UPI0036244134